MGTKYRIVRSGDYDYLCELAEHLNEGQWLDSKDRFYYVEELPPDEWEGEELFQLSVEEIELSDYEEDPNILEYEKYCEKKEQEYESGELSLISYDFRTIKRGWWNPNEDYGAESHEYGIGAISVDDAKARLKVDRNRFCQFMNKGLFSCPRTFLGRFLFKKFFEIANYCEHHDIMLGKGQAAMLFYVADTVLKSLSIEKWWDILECQARFLVNAEEMGRILDLLFADCVMRESVKATLEILKDEPDEEGILDRLNDKETDKLFSEVRERCNIVKAVKAMNETVKDTARENRESLARNTETVKENTETVKDAARAVDGNTVSVEAMKETVEAVKEQMLEASHFPKTGIPLSLTDAADLLWAVFRDELQHLPQCKSKTPEQLFPLGVNKDDTTNLRKFFDRRTKEKELDSRKAKAKNNREIIAYDMADYYELMLEKLPLSIQNHFREKATFEAIVKKLMTAHDLKS